VKKAPYPEWANLESLADLRQSIRVVFDAALAQMDEQDAMKLADKWQQYSESLES